MSRKKGEHETRQYAEFRREWRTLGAVTIAASFGFPTLAFFSIGVFAPILNDQFDWSFSMMMSGIFLASVSILFLGPLVGRYIDSRGAIKLSALALIGFGIGFISLGFSTGSVILYFVSWTIMSVTGVGATAICFTHVINHTFHQRRGLALGIALSSSGLSAMIVKPLAGLAIVLLGWRETIILVGLLPIVIGAPVLYFGTRNSTYASRESFERPDGTPVPSHGLTRSKAARTWQFWILMIAFTAIAFGNGAPIPNLENILQTRHFSAAEIVTITSMIGASLVVGRVIGGWLIDQIWAPSVGCILLVGAAAGCLLLSLADTMLSAQTAVVLISVAAGVEYDLLSFLVAKYLGRRHYGEIYSLLFGAFAVSTGVGPVILGRLYDLNGDYGKGLVLCAGLLVFAGMLLLTLGRYPMQGQTGETNASQGQP